MQIIFPYYRDRPSITFQLLSKNGRWRYYTALIDSGADFSIFPYLTAEILGIALASSQKIIVQSADGDDFVVYRTHLTAKIADKIISLPVGFSKNIQASHLVGRDVLFDLFKIEFDQQNRKVTFNSYN